MLSPEIVAEFKAHYLKSWPRTTLHSLCAPLSEGLAFMWDNLLHAVRQDLPEALQKHQPSAFCWPCCMMVWRVRCLLSETVT